MKESEVQSARYIVFYILSFIIYVSGVLNLFFWGFGSKDLLIKILIFIVTMSFGYSYYALGNHMRKHDTKIWKD